MIVLPEGPSGGGIVSMQAGLLTLTILVFGSVFWLGLYLISRDIRSIRVCLVGSGLICYALALICEVLRHYTDASTAYWDIAHLCWLVLSILVLLSASISMYIASGNGHEQSPPVRTQYRLSRVYLLSFILFALEFGLLLLPLDDMLHTWLLLLAGINLLGSGLAVAMLDAINRAEALLPDLFRSFDYSLGVALLFGSQVVLVMLLGTGITSTMLALLMGVIATAIITQVFSDAAVTLMDTFAFSRFPWLQKARANLRTTASVLPRIQQNPDLEQLDEAEFTRLTRRALSNFGDLSRLATNPLTRLPVVQERLSRHARPDDALERANELKALLSESVSRLKPRGMDEFGTSDEWRYYNALYFPYISGLKPYSRRATHPPADPVARKALEWFRAQVPERTLYNWQSAATKLVVQDLRNKKC